MSGIGGAAHIQIQKDFWSEKHHFYGRGGAADTTEYPWGRFKKVGR